MTARRREKGNSRAPAPAFRIGARALLPVAFAVACAHVPAHAQSRFGAKVALASQLADRGVAISSATPILQGAVSWTSASGWSLGLAAGTELRDPGTPVLAVARASRAWAPSADWLVQASLLHYDYRRAGGRGRRAGNPDRLDASLYFSYRDSLNFGLSAMRQDGGTGQRVLGAADASLSWPLARHLSLSAGAGIAQANVAAYRRRPYPGGGGTYGYRYDRVQVYGYGNLGLAWSDGPWRLQVDRNASSLGDRRVYGERTPAWLATLSRSF
jgi:hypothetical protein